MGPKYLKAYDVIVSMQPKAIVPLESLLESITNGQTPRLHDLSTGEVPFLTAEHVSDFRINFDSDKRVTTQQHEGELKRTQLREGDILVTIKGRIGNAALIEGWSSPANINQDVALLRVKKGIDPHYIVGYLNSAIGKALTKQVCTGQINPFLGLGNLRQIPIPLLEEPVMERCGAQIRAEISQAHQAYTEASRLSAVAKRRIEALITGQE